MLLPELGEIHEQFLALARWARENGGHDGGLSGDLGGSLGGRLLLRAGFAEGISVLAAGGIAGAAALCVDPDAERLREGLRHGLCDFLVADLSEALRILKNEIRRRRAVSVCVSADPETVLAEMAERGVQPDMLSFSSQNLPPAAGGFGIFIERGAVPVPAAQPDPGTERLLWSVPSESVRVLPQLARTASAALEEQREDTPARRVWLADAPRRLGRSFAGSQCLRMTSSEVGAFEQRARAEFPAVSIARDRFRQ